MPTKHEKLSRQQHLELLREEFFKDLHGLDKIDTSTHSVVKDDVLKHSNALKDLGIFDANKIGKKKQTSVLNHILGCLKSYYGSSIVEDIHAAGLSESEIAKRRRKFAKRQHDFYDGKLGLYMRRLETVMMENELNEIRSNSAVLKEAMQSISEGVYFKSPLDHFNINVEEVFPVEILESIAPNYFLLDGNTKNMFLNMIFEIQPSFPVLLTKNFFIMELLYHMLTNSNQLSGGFTFWMGQKIMEVNRDERNESILFNFEYYIEKYKQTRTSILSVSTRQDINSSPTLSTIFDYGSSRFQQGFGDDWTKNPELIKTLKAIPQLYDSSKANVSNNNESNQVINVEEEGHDDQPAAKKSCLELEDEGNFN